MVLPGALLQIRYLAFVLLPIQNPFGEVVASVHVFHSIHPACFPVCRNERSVHNRRVLEHELLDGGALARLGVGRFVKTLEEVRPVGIGAGDVVLRLISKPLFDALINGCMLAGNAPRGTTKKLTVLTAASTSLFLLRSSGWTSANSFIFSGSSTGGSSLSLSFHG